MFYLISQDWTNTSNNHAGIKYLCNTLEKLYPNEFRSIVMPDRVRIRVSKNKIEQLLNILKARVNQFSYYIKLASELSKKYITDDWIIIMEYDTSNGSVLLTKLLRKKCKSIKIAGMAHLVPSKYDVKLSSQKKFSNWTDSVDRIITLGSSLSSYFVSRGVPPKKVLTTFHYVDYYYYKTITSENKQNISAIVMGNQMRDNSFLRDIVGECPEIHFIICQGMKDLTSEYSGLSNVTLVPFVDEPVLRDYMEKSDISLNIMVDTIGSNVIVTSMAMGLAMVCTDVGSIRNYCDEENTIFCREKNDYITALKSLALDKSKLDSLKISALHKAKNFSIEKFKIDLESQLIG